MQTTSFQGLNSQAGSYKPARPQFSGLRAVAATTPTQALDRVRFSAHANESDKTQETEKPKELSKPKRLWRGIKTGTKWAFNPKEMAIDFGWGCVCTAVFALFLHGFALASIPMYMTLGGIMRFIRGAYRGYKGDSAA